MKKTTSHFSFINVPKVVLDKIRFVQTNSKVLLRNIKPRERSYGGVVRVHFAKNTFFDRRLLPRRGARGHRRGQIRTNWSQEIVLECRDVKNRPVVQKLQPLKVGHFSENLGNPGVPRRARVLAPPKSEHPRAFGRFFDYICV